MLGRDVYIADEVAEHVHRVDARRAAVVPPVLRARHVEVGAGQQILVKIQKACNVIPS